MMGKKGGYVGQRGRYELKRASVSLFRTFFFLICKPYNYEYSIAGTGFMHFDELTY